MSPRKGEGAGISPPLNLKALGPELHEDTVDGPSKTDCRLVVRAEALLSPVLPLDPIGVSVH